MVKTVVRHATRVGYKHIAKPLLFKRHPDDAHHDTINAIKYVQHVPGVRKMPMLWAHNSKSLKQNILGLDFANPVGLSAGFDKNIDTATVMRNIGFGFMIGGSVTAEPCDGNPKPWFFRLPKTKSLLVYAGLPNQGIDKIANRIARYPNNVFNGFPLSVSVAKTNSPAAANDSSAIADYCASLRVLEDRDLCQMYEINISCPNTSGGEPFTTPERLENLLLAVDKLGLTKPICVKMPIDKAWNEFKDLLDVVINHKVDAVTIGNLMKNREQAVIKDKLPKDIKGSLSGVPTRDITTNLISKTYQSYGDKLIIIGVGGIFCAKDAYEKIKAGASLVALITGLIFEGPQLVGEINADLEKLIKRDGLTNISELIGSANTAADV